MTVSGKELRLAMSPRLFGVSEAHRPASFGAGKREARLSSYSAGHWWRSQANRSERTWAVYSHIGRTVRHRWRNQQLRKQDRMHGRSRCRSRRFVVEAESFGLALCAASVYVQVQKSDVQIFLILPTREMQRAFVDGKKHKKAGERVLPQPVQPKIYHIVHVDRLPSIIASGGLLPDSVMRNYAQRAPASTNIGLSGIKKQRLTRPVSCHSDLCLGDCVPFYFCPRSVMLYVISCKNHPQLSYRGGQDPIAHLEADLMKTIEFADEQRFRWAFTNSNASSAYCDSWNSVQDLGKIDWDAVQARYWSDPTVKDHKQAEFLIERSFAWSLVERIGVKSQQVCATVAAALNQATHKPQVSVMSSWYY